MEARNRTAGDGYEERRHDGHRLRRELEVAERRHFRHFVAAEQYCAHKPQCHEYQCRPEERIEFADDFVYRQQRGDEVVDDDYAYPRVVGDLRNHLPEDARGRAQEHDADQHEQHYREQPHELLHAAAEIATDDFGDAQPVVAHEYDARHEIVHRAHEYAAERYPEECDRTETCAQYRAENRSYAGDVEQLDEEYAPARHRHVIDAVVEPSARYVGGRVDAADALQVTPVGEVCCDEQRETN